MKNSSSFKLPIDPKCPNRTRSKKRELMKKLVQALHMLIFLPVIVFYGSIEVILNLAACSVIQSKMIILRRVMLFPILAILKYLNVFVNISQILAYSNGTYILKM